MSMWLTDEEAGRLCRKSGETIARWRRAGLFPYLPGRPCLIDARDFLDFMEKKKQCKPQNRTVYAGTVPAFGKSSGPSQPRNPAKTELQKALGRQSKLSAVRRSLQQKNFGAKK